jgi:alpha-1,3-rhamnosyl/mannosyltransferase
MRSRSDFVRARKTANSQQPTAIVNILFDARVIQDHFPGIGRYAFNLLAALPAELRDDERITVLHDPSAPSTRLPIHALREQPHPRVRWQAWPVPVFGVKNLAAKMPHDAEGVAHFPYYMRPAFAGVPALTTIYDTISFVYPEYVPSGRTRWIIRALHSLAVRNSQRVLTISQSAANDIARFLPPAKDKLVVTPLASDPFFAPQGEEAIRNVRKQLGLQSPFAFYLASNKPHKNLVRLVEAWELVNRDWRLETGEAPVFNLQLPLLVIAGHVDPRYPQAEQRVKELGLEQHVRFVGPVSDAQAAALYSACGLFVYPSLYEGFGLTPLEAMACGAPVACSNTSAMPEVAGDAALLFGPMQPEEIAQACLRVLRDDALRASMRERSLKQAAQFSWQKTAQLTIDAYRLTLAKSKA